MEAPNYYAIIPADVRYDCRLTDKEKLLYGEITALSNKEGCCWASNEYFSRLYNSSIRTIKGAVTKLEKCGYLKRVLLYKENSKEVEKRLLYPVTKFALPSENNFTTPGEENFHYPGEKNCTDNNTSKKNNTSINNTSNNIYSYDTLSALIKEDFGHVTEVDDFVCIIQDWLNYKKDKKQSYKGLTQVKVLVKHLIEKSGGNKDKARLMVEQSIANNYSGIFELKEKTNYNTTSTKPKEKYKGVLQWYLENNDFKEEYNV